MGCGNTTVHDLSYLVPFKDKFEISITCPGTNIHSDQVYLDWTVKDIFAKIGCLDFIQTLLLLSLLVVL